MGQTILTPHQSQFLELAAKQQSLVKKYYLTGGTALSAFYYQHRLSYDLDFFTETDEVNQTAIDIFLKRISPQLNITHIEKTVFLGLVSYLLHFKDQQQLKIDFNYYPFPRIKTGSKFLNLSVDSLYDIAANKLHTIYMQPRSRDYIDLYLIMTKEKLVLDKLIIAAKTKFDWHIDKFGLASQFMRCQDYDESGLMLIPFNQKVMQNYYTKLATALKKEYLT